MPFKNVSQVFSLIQASKLQNICASQVENKGILLDIKRDDLIHPIISGNKWRKLKYLLLKIEKQGCRSVATMGGMHSNFIHALSYVCCLLGWECELYLRGFTEQALTPTMIDCLKWNAKINYVDRNNFRILRTEPPKLSEEVFWIKEGGLHQESLFGIKEIMMELRQQYNYIVVATATGTSLAGLINAAGIYQPNAKIIGICVLNNLEQQRKDVCQLIKNNKTDWSILEGYEFGGFAKSNSDLDLFVNEFSHKHGIPLEPIYSGKSFYAVMDLINKDYFEQGSRILLIHCGGLQGNR